MIILISFDEAIENTSKLAAHAIIVAVAGEWMNEWMNRWMEGPLALADFIFRY